jgi:hypothetical protein
MQSTGDISKEDGVPDCSTMKPEDYILIDINQDREAAHRWNAANEIRRNKRGAKASIIEYLRINVGKIVTGEELRYVARNAAEWARRVRELRTEDGWPIRSRQNGRPDLANGTYILEEDRQAPSHDRQIEDQVRREVLKRDGYSCCACDWNREAWNADDPRYLELHHVKHHATGGENSVNNLITLCNICHDIKHRKTNDP